MWLQLSMRDDMPDEYSIHKNVTSKSKYLVVSTYAIYVVG